MRHAAWFATVGLLAAFVSPASGIADDPPPPRETPAPPSPPPPVPIFLNSPSDLEAFWKSFDRPDYVILPGSAYRKLRDEADPVKPPARPLGAVPTSVGAVGDVVGDQARLVLEYRFSVDVEGPTWVALQLGGLPIASVKESGLDLPSRLGPDRAWEVELSGRGEHVVRVALIANVATTADGRRIELAIPPAASTRIDLAVPRPVLDAATGPGEPVAVEMTDPRAGARLSARLSPRSRLSLAWRERNDPATDLPVLLSARGEIAVDVVAGSVRTRGAWSVEAVRGSTSQVTFRVEAGEEVIDVEVAGQPVPIVVRREEGRASVVVALGQPLLAGSTRRVVLTTARPTPPEGPSRIALRGHPIDQARVQAGMLAIARSGALFLNATVGRGLRRIDPRTELSEGLRTRPETVLAFEFAEQPYELALAIEPAPPQIRVASRSTVAVGPQSARVDATLRYEVRQGRAYEVQVGLPRGLDFRDAGPADLVASTLVVAARPGADGPVGDSIDRVLSIRLSRLASTSDTFTLNLRGAASVEGAGLVLVPLFDPRADLFEAGWAAIVSPRNLSVGLPEGSEGSSPYEPEWGAPPADWAWPGAGPPPAEAAILWLRGEGRVRPASLLLKARPRTIRVESAIAATVDRTGVEVVDEVSGKVSAGSIAQITLNVPPQVPATWEVEGIALTARESLGMDEDGSRRVRLALVQEVADSFRFRVRYRKPLPGPATDRHPVDLRIAPIRMVEATCTGRTLEVASDSSLDIQADAEGWTRRDRRQGSASIEAGSPARLMMSGPGEAGSPIRLVIRAAEQVPMPAVVASRLWLRTTQRADFDLATQAYFFVEAREGSMEVGLPPGSRWARCRVGEVELRVDGVDRLATDLYRIRFPSPRSPGAALVLVEFVVPAASVGPALPTLRLAEGTVMQTLWEVRLSGQRAGVGVPSGWTDENQWYWDGLLWRRRPARSPAELASWLAGGNGRFRINVPLEPGDSAEHHGYLFSRSGPPAPLPFAIYSRTLLVLSCSGPPLLFGLLILARRPPLRSIVAAVLLLVFGATAFFDPSSILLVAQSSILGLALLAMAIVMNWALGAAERVPRRPRAQARHRPGRAGLVADRRPVDRLGRFHGDPAPIDPGPDLDGRARGDHADPRRRRGGGLDPGLPPPMNRPIVPDRRAAAGLIAALGADPPRGLDAGRSSRSGSPRRGSGPGSPPGPPSRS